MRLRRLPIVGMLCACVLGGPSPGLADTAQTADTGGDDAAPLSDDAVPLSAEVVLDRALEKRFDLDARASISITVTSRSGQTDRKQA